MPRSTAVTIKALVLSPHSNPYRLPYDEAPLWYDSEGMQLARKLSSSSGRGGSVRRFRVQGLISDFEGPGES